MARRAMMAAGDLWGFVREFYARPGVAALCLALQERHGADVTLLLFLLARAARGQALDAAAIARLNVASAPWRAGVIAPLRALRRQLLSPPPGIAAGALRQMLADSEIEAERLQLLHLDSLTGAGVGEPDAAAAPASLHAYARAADFPEVALHPLLALFQAAAGEQQQT